MLTESRRRSGLCRRKAGSEQREFVGPSALAEGPRLHSRRAAENSGVDQAQYQRESVPSLAERLAEHHGCDRRTATSISKPDGRTAARETGGLSRVLP